MHREAVGQQIMRHLSPVCNLIRAPHLQVGIQQNSNPQSWGGRRVHPGSQMQVRHPVCQQALQAGAQISCTKLGMVQQTRNEVSAEPASDSMPPIEVSRMMSGYKWNTLETIA